MKEWQKITFNALANVAVALIAGGFLKVFYYQKDEISGVYVAIVGCIFFKLSFLHSKKDRKMTFTFDTFTILATVVAVWGVGFAYWVSIAEKGKDKKDLKTAH